MTSHAHQGNGRITTEMVMLAILEAIHGREEDATFTTREIAEEIGVNEYPVRLAFSWLCRFGKISAVDGKAIERTTRTTGKKYEVALYRVKAASTTTVEFQAFYMRICGGRG